MDCKKFRRLYSKYMQLETEVEPEWCVDWEDHLDVCIECSDWFLAKAVKGRGVDIKQYPCVHIAYYATIPCELHDDPMDCPDIVVVKNFDGKDYGIPIRDGENSEAHSCITFNNCPWCGISLKRRNK